MDVDQEQNVNSESNEARSEAPTNSSQSDSTIPSQATDPEKDLQIEDSGNVTKLRSPAWKHFDRFQNSKGEWKAKCKADLGGETRNGTHHLHVHLKRCKRKGTVDIRQALLVHNFTKGKEMTAGIFDQEKTRDLVNMIIMNEYPLAMVEHRGFLRYSNSMQPLFKVPTRNTIKADALKVYESEKLKTMEMLDQVEGRIAITTDMWTSKQKRGYMAITAHFIDKSWTLRSQILRNMNRTRTSAGRTELDNYLEEPPLPRNTPNFDILVWWKINGHKYPILQAIARDLLAIPISTVASESAFSTGGRVVSPHRNKLHPKMVEILMCAQNWILANEKHDEDTVAKNDFAKLGEDFSLENAEDSPPPSLDANEGVQG